MASQTDPSSARGLKGPTFAGNLNLSFYTRPTPILTTKAIVLWWLLLLEAKPPPWQISDPNHQASRALSSVLSISAAFR